MARHRARMVGSPLLGDPMHPMDVARLEPPKPREADMSGHEHQWVLVRPHHRYTIHRCPCGTTTKTMKEQP